MFSNSKDRSEHQSFLAKKRIEEKGHPRGMFGKSHSEITKKMLSKTSKRAWIEKSDKERIEITMKMLKTKVKNGTYAQERQKTTWKAGWREIGEKRKYYRSRWEANYARYLEFLKKNGDIKAWEHEPKVFWFEGIKRGCVSYLPDFWVKELDDSESYHEVKGWMDSKSKTKLKRMKKYFPEVKMVLIQEKQYKEIGKKLGGLIDGWE